MEVSPFGVPPIPDPGGLIPPLKIDEPVATPPSVRNNPSSSIGIAHSSAISKRNKDTKYDKPNEDFIVHDPANGIFIVCDGVTRSPVPNKIYPSPSPSARASESFAKGTHAELIALLDSVPPLEALRQAMMKGNQDVAQLNRDLGLGGDYLTNDLAGTVGIVGTIRDDKFIYGIAGDVSLYLISDDGVFQYTKKQTLALEQYRKDHKNDPYDDVRVITRRDFRNNPNNSNAYGSFTGDPRVMSLVEYGEIALKPGDRLALASDGLDYLFSKLFDTHLLDKKLLRHVHRTCAEQQDPKILITRVERLERLQKSIRSDDKSLILIEIGSSGSSHLP